MVRIRGGGCRRNEMGQEIKEGRRFSATSPFRRQSLSGLALWLLDQLNVAQGTLYRIQVWVLRGPAASAFLLLEAKCQETQSILPEREATWRRLEAVTSHGRRLGGGGRHPSWQHQAPQACEKGLHGLRVQPCCQPVGVLWEAPTKTDRRTTQSTHGRVRNDNLVLRHKVLGWFVT